jgi:hypothetical protein
LPEAQLIICWLKCFEDGDESTRASGGGQLPKFGAVEEKTGRWFLEMSGDEGNLLEGIDSAIWRAVFLEGSDWEEKFIVVDQRNFHSVCTGNAER